MSLQLFAYFLKKIVCSYADDNEAFKTHLKCLNIYL